MRFIMTALLAVAVGCGHTQPAAGPATGPQQQPGGDRIDVEVESAPPGAPSETVGAWTIYGVALAAAATKTERPSDYAGELEAREMLADTWKQSRAGGRIRDAYLDRLVEVSDAGFMAEYVVTFLARPGWIVPAADLAKLKLAAFRAWAPGHLGKHHEPETRAAVRLAASASALAVPGDRLPASQEIDPQRVPCASLEASVARALAGWDAEEARLGAVPLSVMSGEELLPVFERAARDARARRDGVVLVSPKVANAVFVAGFCAVERGAFADAERFLRRAVALSPGNANIRGELVQTLIVQKKLDQADTELDAALELATSACHAAMLWRKRGYVLFDRGKLVDSYRAYARSLELDPGSSIARREMQLIVQELRRSGGYDEKALKAYNPPPPGALTVSRCK